MAAERIVVRDTFTFSDRAEVLNGIARIEGAARYTEDAAVVRFSIRRDNPEKADDPIRLGHLDVFSSVVHVWTGSPSRGDEMRARLEAALGERVKFEKRRARNKKQLAEESRRRLARGVIPDGEVASAFFQAFAEYWRAEPWKKFPLNAVIELESEDFGHNGAVFISPHQAITVFRSIAEVTAFYTFLERGGSGPHPPMLVTGFVDVGSRPTAEQESFRAADYELAAPNAYPVCSHVISMKPEKPSMDDLTWMEGIARALAEVARSMADESSWENLRSRALEIRTHRDVGAMLVKPINEHAGAPTTTVETIKIHEESILKKTGARTMAQAIRWVHEEAENMGRN
jgi:hypothetical protein